MKNKLNVTFPVKIYVHIFSQNRYIGRKICVNIPHDILLTYNPCLSGRVYCSIDKVPGGVRKGRAHPLVGIN